MRRSVSVVLAFAALAGPVTARAAPAAPDQVGEVGEVAAAEARRHFARGSAYFKLADYDQALTEFRAAYSFSQAPGLLFNMGQAARSARRYDIATTYYRAYLAAVPDAPERAYVEERLRDMALLVPAAKPAELEAASASAPAPASSPASSVAARAPAGDRGRNLRIAGIATAAAGVALAATTVFFAVKASDASDEVSRAFVDGDSWSARLDELYASGRRDERIAIVCGAGAATLVAGGAVMWLLGAREARRTRVAVDPAKGGLAVTVAWPF